jgi:hypothetical protein
MQRNDSGRPKSNLKRLISDHSDDCTNLREDFLDLQIKYNYLLRKKKINSSGWSQAHRAIAKDGNLNEVSFGTAIIDF